MEIVRPSSCNGIDYRISNQNAYNEFFTDTAT